MVVVTGAFYVRMIMFDKPSRPVSTGGELKPQKDRPATFLSKALTGVLQKVPYVLMSAATRR
jgi:hypothetical protein